MRDSTKSLRTGMLCLLFGALLTISTSCGGGGGAGSGDTAGEDTLPVILDLQTPLGLQGTRGTGPDISLVYHVRDREFDPTDVEVQYGTDLDRSGAIDENEFMNATPGAGGDGTTDLNASPGIGAVHSFVWDSRADIVSGRWVTQDYVYTETGRVALDDFGDPIFQSFPGTVIRVRPISNGQIGAWRYSDPFDVNNNNRPVAEVGTVEFPPEGQADQTVNEQVLVGWKASDPDGDPVTIAVDWVSVPEGYDPQAATREDLEGLPWTPATSGALGEGTYLLDASPEGIDHRFAWNTVPDAGTANQWVMLRFRPIDGKLEVGDWSYSTAPFHLDNYTIFTDPDASLPTALAGSRAVLLRDDNIETVLVTGGSGTEGGDGTDFAGFFYPGRTQTTKGVFAVLASGMQKPRVGHTATRLLDGRVLIVGGAGDGTVGDTAEIFDPATRTFTLLSSRLTTERRDHVAVLMPSGDVLVAGGRDENGTILRSADVFRTATGTFEAVGAGVAMGEARTGAAATVLPDGRVLVAGGRGNAGPLATVEIYDPAMGGFAVTDVGNDMDRAREGLTLTGTVDATFAAVAAGGMASPPTNTIERFDWRTEGFSASAATMRTGRAFHSAVRLGDGRILFAGGQQDESGVLTPLADVYDPSTDSLDVPNGDMLTAVKDSAVTILQKGRAVFFGGLVSAAATDAVQIFTPDGGFNERPIAQIADMLGALEPWSFGVRIRWRAIDPEGDPVRIVCQFLIKSSGSDDSGLLPASIKDRWLPATMADQTVLGEQSSGLTALTSRSDFVDTVDNPIDAPDVDPGEHLFVWETSTDIPKGDYDNVFFRIFVYGAEEGTGVQSQRFSIAKNAPVIARIEAPLNTWGNIVVPYYLQDSDAGERARVDWEYGVDENGDGKIVEADGEEWFSPRHATVDVTLGGTTYSDTGTVDLVTGSKSPDPNNEKTVNGIPWGKKHYFVWDSVYDLGAPATARSDVILRCTPYDYPSGSPGNASLGIDQTRGGFTLEKDPNGLFLTNWSPSVTSASGTYRFEGVRLDEPLVFEFSDDVDPASVAGSNGWNAIQVTKDGGGPLVQGYCAVSGSTVTFYPQVQEVPARSDVLGANTGYTVTIFGYDPADRSHAVVQRKGADPSDTNARVLLLSQQEAKAFRTGSTVLPETTAPTFVARVLPTTGSGVATSSPIRVEFDDRLMAGTVNYAGLQVIAKAFSGVESVVNGTFDLDNIVDESGPGGTLRKYSVLTFTPDVALPADAVTIEIRMATTLRDLAGNALASAALSSFTTAPAGSTVPASFVESFDDKDQRDDALTTAFWGIYDPVNKGNAAGSGVAGKLTGLYDFGDGSDGPLDLTSGDRTIDTDTQSVWNLTSLIIPHGRKLTVKGSKPLELRVQGDVRIEGTLDASGQDGQPSVAYDMYSGKTSKPSGYGGAGGRGGPGGGDGGGGGYYTWKQTTAPSTSNGKTGYGADSGSPGTAGQGAEYNPNNKTQDSYYAPAGGGAGHANDGTDGGFGYSGYSLTQGKGGSKFGFSDLRNGLEAGSGGGAGGGATYYYPYTSGSYTYNQYGHTSGGGGGGGGGAVKITASGRISVTGAGELLANGGNGGDTLPYYPYQRIYYEYLYSSSYKYYSESYMTTYPGGGGGGSGGSVHLQAGSGFDLHGKVDVRGGEGGLGRKYSSSYDMIGGDGGDGRIVLEGPEAVSIADAADLRGCLTVKSSGGISGGSGATSWTVSSNTTVYTDSGSGAPSGVYSGGKFFVKDFTVKKGVTLRIVGSQPFRLYASGDVAIEGTVDASGSAGSSYTSASSYSSSSGWRPYTIIYGGSGGPGGGTGGNNASSTSYTNPAHPGMPGYGPSVDAKSNGKGAGQGGAMGTPQDYGYRYEYTTYTRQYYYQYYYLASGGGGGGSAEAGETAPQRYGYTSQGVGGKPGQGGTSLYSDAVMDEGSITGGAGGGGGANGGYRYYYQYMNSKGTVTYTYSGTYYGYGTSVAGGGGGGGFLVVASGSISVSGKIDVRGGDGGDRYYSSYTYVMYSGAGGGGGGGNVCLKAADGFDLDGGTIDATGGEGGESYYNTSTYNYPRYSWGGRGGRGAITLIAGTGHQPDVVNAGNTELGSSGTVETGTFGVTKDGISKWQDSGATAPDYGSFSFTGTGIANLWVQGAQTNPDTGQPDLGKTTGWQPAASLSSVDGYRWFRVWVELQGTSVPGTAPAVDSVTLTWTSKK